ncbi:hypothetical protein CBS470a_010366 [Colletotrichum nupharicola]|nr:hypothetical protein CBS470a_010366 [Colletotrichum nupharicola]
MLFTTAQGLQDTIAAIKTRSKHHILNLLVSPEVDEIWFHVPSHFNQLKVLRCAAEGHERGVRIRLADIANIPNWARCRNQFTESEQAELRQHFDTLSAVGGVYVKYAFGFHALELGAAGAKAATVVTAAGPAVVMGVTAAAAVYFIPWESLMDWLKGALSFLWGKVCAVWERFKDWVMHLFGGHTGPRPMEFAV